MKKSWAEQLFGVNEKEAMYWVMMVCMLSCAFWLILLYFT